MSAFPRDEHPDWPEALATVLSCTYTARAGRALAWGLPSAKHFRISYNYWADNALHTGEFFSEKPIAQGSLLPIRYDPALPGRHLGDTASGLPRARLRVLLSVGLAGSVLLSLAWLLVLRGCQP